MNTQPTPETEKLYKLAIYHLPYDTNNRANYQVWHTVGLLKSHMERFERQLDEARGQRDRLAEVIEAASVLIAAKGRYNTMLAYDGLREALQSLNPEP